MDGTGMEMAPLINGLGFLTLVKQLQHHILGIKEGTMRSRLKHGMNMVRKAYGQIRYQ
jgi:hypothetical protein